MFERHELEALLVGVRLAEAWCGPGLAASARSALARIRGAVPAALLARIDEAPAYAPRFARGAAPRHFELAYRAISRGSRLEMGYTADDGTQSSRVVRPLGLYFWGNVWTLAAWCELRRDFRTFRLDRLREPREGSAFAAEPDKSLESFLARVRPESGR
jgi:predicted DNA-binding transcriptional regulator YafY